MRGLTVCEDAQQYEGFVRQGSRVYVVDELFNSPNQHSISTVVWDIPRLHECWKQIPMGEIAEQSGLKCSARNLQRNLYRFPPDGHAPSIADIPLQPGDKIGKHRIDIVQARQQSNDIR